MGDEVTVRAYTVGFLYDARGRVVLVRKNKPQWQAGLLNGVGGKIEEGENPLACMIREFKEETGLIQREWDYVTTMEGPCPDDPEPWIVYVFRAFVDEIPAEILETSDVGEAIGIYDAELTVILEATVPNLKWLIPLCQDRSIILTGKR